MRAFLTAWLMALIPASAFAQEAGIPPEWEVRKLLDSLVLNANKLGPYIDQVNPEAWKEKGAPEAYLQQWQRVRQSISYLQISSKNLAQEPGRVSLALDTLNRLENLNLYLGSLASGIRKYHNPALSDLILAVADENANNRESLKQYAMDLAATKEAEMRLMESEAQRCLGIIVKQAPPPRPARPPVRTAPAAPGQPGQKPADKKDRP